MFSRKHFPFKSLVSATFIGAFTLLTCQSIPAQNAQPKPVARLISSSRAVERATYGGSEATAKRKVGVFPRLADATSIERRAFDVTNNVRAKNGLPPLVWDPELSALARSHSESMARLGYFGHETPEGHRLRDRARAAGIQHWKVLAENIAYNQGYDDPGAFAVERWMISPGHRANILDNEFRRTAIGSYVAANGRVYITQVFITRLTP